MFDWITGLVESGGYLGIAFLMFAENIFPPIPSELIMPLAGFTAARGELSLPLAVLAGALGSLAGATIWYYVGQLLGYDRLRAASARYGRWMTVSPDDLDRAQAFFLRHSGKAVFLGRLIPAIRTLISVPAGIVRMPLAPFLAYSTIGTALWTLLLAAAGYMLEAQYELVEAWLNPVTNVILAAILVLYVYRVATFPNAPQH
jgi:membrane protein DedA with SNARE-associated domain